MSFIDLIQVVYLVAFAAMHSLLASKQFKGLVWRRFGPKMDRWYMKFFSIFAAITFMPLAIMLLLFPGRKLYVIPSPWRWIMVGIQLLSCIWIVKGFRDAPHRFFISQQLSKSKEAKPLAPRGVYCYVRDPFLASGLLGMWMTPFMTTKLLITYLLASIYLYLGSLHWERRLLAQFRNEYKNYQIKVPRMIPWKGRGCPVESI
ncbi:MAG: isoprenylcysteine carboxylmethyltransferase family protein [Methanotrichaceae archaeon]|nr:isoprenylcysteine carboxylmethyltransferase family protein [Methanotrichaceae archaeon]